MSYSLHYFATFLYLIFGASDQGVVFQCTRAVPLEQTTVGEHNKHDEQKEAEFQMNTVNSDQKGSLLLATNDASVYNTNQTYVSCQSFIPGIIMCLEIHAYENNTKTGTATCRPLSGTAFINAGKGSLQGHTFKNCASFTTASPTLLLPVSRAMLQRSNYSCEAIIYSGKQKGTNTITGKITQLIPRVHPDIPELHLSKAIFHEHDNASIACYSFNGWPPAAVKLKVTKWNGDELESSGIESANMTLKDISWQWHGAIITCNVVNHNFVDATRGILQIYHLCILQQRNIANTYHDRKVLNCSTKISSFPEATYSWSFPKHVTPSNVTNLSDSTLAVQSQQQGFFNCTAINPITSKEVMVTFEVYGQMNVTEMNEMLTQTWFSWLLMTLMLLTFFAFTSTYCYWRRRREVKELCMGGFINNDLQMMAIQKLYIRPVSKLSQILRTIHW